MAKMGVIFRRQIDAIVVKGLDWFIENAKCPSCKQDGGPPGCEVRKCCSEKGLHICFECEEFPCPKFKEYADPDTMDRYNRFKEIGFEKWVEEQMQKAKKGYEIHLQKVASLKQQQLNGKVNPQ